MVTLPRKYPTPQLGRSRDVALKRYLANERSLKKQGNWEAFDTGVTKYLRLGHAELVPLHDLQKPHSQSFYLPMHGVTKESSTTTKLRIVYDASAKTSTGVSLNDTLLPGPSMYPLLTTTVTQFRTHKIGMCSDTSKMFREIGLQPEEYDFHRFLHRDETGNIRDYRMKRLTFGVTCSPYLATQVLRQLASDYRQEFPIAAQIIENSFYVDDCLTGSNTLEEALTVRENLNVVMKKGMMTLRKWRSSSRELLDTIPKELKESGDLLIASRLGEYSKTLRVHWNTLSDTLHVSTLDIDPNHVVTKRHIA